MSAGVNLYCACVLEKGESRAWEKEEQKGDGTGGIYIKSHISEWFFSTLCLLGRF